MPDLSTARRAPLVAESTLVRPLPPATRYILRGGPQVMDAAGEVLGLSIGETPCRAAVHGDRAALWLGPDEQLLLAPEGATAEIAGLFGPRFRDLPHSLVDVSQRQIALQVSGPHAATVLSAGCPLDLDLSAFPVGMCARTMLAKAEIVLWRTADGVFRIEVWRSFATYASRFLAAAAREVI